MHIGVRLPGIDQNRLPVRERHQLFADGKLGVCALDLDQHMAMRMRMAHERAIHVEQGDTAEISVDDAQCRRHCR